MVAYLTAFVSVVALTMNTWSTIAKPRSETTVSIVGSTSENLLVAVVNSGNAASKARQFSLTSNDDILRFGEISCHKDDEVKRFSKSRDENILRLYIGSVTLGPKAARKRFWQNYGAMPIRLNCLVVESDGSRKTVEDIAELADIRKVVEDKCADCRDSQ